MSHERLNGELLKACRAKMGLDHSAMAARIGVSPSTYRQMESGYLPVRNRAEILARLTTETGTGEATLVLKAA